jgi:hypothetical protein
MLIKVLPEDAVRHSLPGVGFSVDTTDSGLAGRPLIHPGWYFVASGPPGGTLSFRVQPSREPESDADAVERAVRPSYANPPPFEVIERGRVELAGSARPAIAFTNGTGFNGTAWCAALVGTPAGSLLVGFGYGPFKLAPSIAALASHASLAVLVRSFALIS